MVELSLARRIEPWTFEDLQRLPESPWRFEIEGTITLTAYVLAPGQLVYTEVGTWREGETAHLTHPKDLTVGIDDLVP